MTRRTLEFWYEFGSTYSYPAAMRVERIAAAADLELRWRPFLLGPIFVAKGQTDSPFNTDPVKGRYMWRELARICRREGIPLVLPPARFVQNSLKAARVALVGEAEGWIPAFTRAVYTANFAEQKDISEDATLIGILNALGVDAARAMAAAGSPEIKAKLKAQTEEAMAREIFGAPFFMVGNEPFWGNDRLEEAVAFAAHSEEVNK
jgi:2-hydroxychromene-2-carboxylate isomerase